MATISRTTRIMHQQRLVVLCRADEVRVGDVDGEIIDEDAVRV